MSSNLTKALIRLQNRDLNFKKNLCFLLTKTVLPLKIKKLDEHDNCER